VAIVLVLEAIAGPAAAVEDVTAAPRAAVTTTAANAQISGLLIASIACTSLCLRDALDV
jgi:hypothetical protein